MTDRQVRPTEEELAAIETDLAFRLLQGKSRENLYRLLAEIRALRTERQQAEERERRLREVLGECQWAAVSYVEWEPEWGYCPVCGRQRNKGHKDDCEVALALAAGKERQE